MTIPLPNTPVGGRLRRFYSQWQALTSDPFILNLVTGMNIPLTEFPRQNRLPHEIVMSQEESRAADEQIEQLLQKRAIVECESINEGDFVSNVFLRRKKSGQHRLILNLKSFNQQVVIYEHFKMESLDQICELMTEGCWMSVVDFCDAYLSMPVNRKFVHLLKFCHKGRILMYIVLPFGLSCAPRLFSKLCRVPLVVLRREGHIVVLYIDDGWICGRTYDDCLNSLRAFLQVFVSLGFLPHPTKCSLTPSQQVVALGFVLNSVTMRISMQPEKVEQIGTIARELLCKPNLVARDIARLVGLFVSCFRATPLGKLHYRSLERV